MLNVDEIIQFLNSQLAEIKAIYLFGSQITDDTDANSDVDIAVLTSSKIDPLVRWNVEQDLARLLDKSVDLVDLLSASTVFQFQVVSKGRCIYDPFNSDITFGAQVYSQYHLLNLERQDILRAIV